MTDQWDRKQHWENIYSSKAEQEVSWFQEVPEISLELIRQTGIAPSAPIIDIGGGESRLALCLQQSGYKNIAVLDIAATALEKAKKRMGAAASSVEWICADVTTFNPGHQYDLWHDRAAFHFLTEEDERQRYITTATAAIRAGGFLILGAFSDKGPLKCSGIEVKRYAAEDLNRLWEKDFEPVSHIYTDHKTPFDTLQHFTFCVFKRKA